MDSIAIAGVGLIGGSFALALRAAGFSGRILGISSPATIAKAKAAGAIDEGVTLEQAAAEADVLYLSQPIGAILTTLERLGQILDRDILVTDAGSTKRAIVEHAQQHLSRGQFLGGHPVAGKETSGFDSADAQLFSGRPYILTPSDPVELDTPAARAFVKWISRANAVLLSMTPGEHDRTLAWTSHLPQLLSTALAGLIGSEEVCNRDVVPAGPGLLDMTRLALSSHHVWGDILSTNRAEVCHALEVYIDKLTEFRENLATSQLGSDFEHAASVAARIRGKR